MIYARVREGKQMYSVLLLITVFFVFLLLTRFVQPFFKKSWKGFLSFVFSILLIISVSAFVGYGYARITTVPYRIDSCLMPPFLYVEGHLQETGHLPTEADFQI